MPNPKLRTCLWFDGQAEEAASFYVSLLPDSRVERVVKGPGGATLLVEFVLGGAAMQGLNGGPQFRFTEAVSLSVDCEDQAEVDRLWDALTAGGGTPSQCGWLKDRYGLSWQIVPRALGELMTDPDPVKVQRTVAAMMQMSKLQMEPLRRAHAGG